MLNRATRFFLWSKQHFEIPEEEAEWVGLSLEEAVEKQRQLEHKVTPSACTHTRTPHQHFTLYALGKINDFILPKAYNLL